MRYFWLKDLIDKEEIVLKYIPSEELVADLLTKAITGAKFKYLRAKLLGEPNEASALGLKGARKNRTEEE